MMHHDHSAENGKLQEFRPDHIMGSLEDRICEAALADCRGFRDEALAAADAEIAKIR